MKKIILFFIISITSAFSLAGCSTKNSQTSEATTTQKISTSSKSTVYDDKNDDKTTESISTKESYDFSSYEKRINAITKKINNAKTSNNTKTNHDRFYSFKKEIDAIDDDLDALDNKFEHAYETKKLGFNDYKSRERSIDKLEDQLELAENALENKFEIHD